MMSRSHTDEAFQEQCLWVRGAPAAVAFLTITCTRTNSTHKKKGKYRKSTIGLINYLVYLTCEKTKCKHDNVWVVFQLFLQFSHARHLK